MLPSRRGCYEGVVWRLCGVRGVMSNSCVHGGRRRSVEAMWSMRCDVEQLCGARRWHYSLVYSTLGFQVTGAEVKMSVCRSVNSYQVRVELDGICSMDWQYVRCR